MQEDPLKTTDKENEDPFSWGYWRTLYPFEGHRLTVAGGAAMNYVDEGEGDPVLMVHGNPTWSFYFRRLILALRRTYRCVAPDHIGCGLSDKPQDYRYRLDRHIENLERLVEELDLRNVTLVCHDWGGAIGMGMAERHHERIKRLVILNTAAFPSKRIPLRINVCRLPIIGPLAIRGLNLFARAAVHMAVVEPARMTPNTVQGYLRPYNSWQNRVAVLRFVQDIPMNPNHPTYPLIKEIGEGLHVFKETPMLICWGGQDFCFNDEFLEEWRERFPGAEVHRFADAGHYVMEDAHEEIIPLVKRFLEASL
jgi:cis-3-alkyl-4-acyloxetan-2-one decarboxylase